MTSCSLSDVALLKWDLLFKSLHLKEKNKVYSIRKEFAPIGANSFLSELTLTEKKKTKGRVPSPLRVPLHLKYPLRKSCFIHFSVQVML